MKDVALGGHAGPVAVVAAAAPTVGRVHHFLQGSVHKPAVCYKRGIRLDAQRAHETIQRQFCSQCDGHWVMMKDRVVRLDFIDRDIG